MVVKVTFSVVLFILLRGGIIYNNDNTPWNGKEFKAVNDTTTSVVPRITNNLAEPTAKATPGFITNTTVVKAGTTNIKKDGE